MSGIDSLKKTSRQGNGTGNQGLDHCVGQVVKYEIADPKGMKADSKADYVYVRLMRDLPRLGLVANFDDEGNPTTEIKVRLRDAEKTDSKFARPEILDKKRGKGQAPAVKAGDWLQFEGMMAEKDGSYSARWVNTFVANYNLEKHFPLIGRQVSIRKSFEREVQGEKREQQNRLHLLEENALVFNGLEDFKQKAVEALTYASELPFDTLLLVRAVDVAEKAASKIEHWRQWDRDAQAPESPERCVERFLQTDDGKKWAEVMENGSEGILWEVVPVVRVSTGSLTLPGNRRATAEGKGTSITDENAYKFDDSYMCRYLDDGRIEYGWVYADSKVERNTNGDRPGPYYSTGTTRTSTSDAIQGEAEFITHNLPDDVKQAFLARAKRPFRGAEPPRRQADNDQSFGHDDAPGHSM